MKSDCKYIVFPDVSSRLRENNMHLSLKEADDNAINIKSVCFIEIVKFLLWGRIVSDVQKPLGLVCFGSEPSSVSYGCSSIYLCL